MFAEISAKGHVYLDEDFESPAVFEVVLLTDLMQSTLKMAKMTIFDAHTNGTNQATAAYIETDASNVSPLSGQISITTFAGVKDYPVVEFDGAKCHLKV